MICRTVTLADGVPRWLLISQLEHARLSGVLAEQCLQQFARKSPELDSVCPELLRAITHHDDGWRQWELAPQCDPQSGAPLNFDQLPVAESLAIWTQSIWAATAIGELAAWIVAAHFSAVFAISEHHRADPRGSDWLEKTTQMRSGWLARWQQQDPAVHTLALAGKALKWLQAFDILSLWPCMSYPVLGERVSDSPQPFEAPEPGWVFRSLGLAHPLPTGIVAKERNARINVSPWPFSQPQVALEAAAHLVPVARYASVEHLLAAREPFAARWVLMGG